MSPYVKLAIVLFWMFAAGVSQADEGALVAPTQAVAQRSQLEWSVLWWKWAASFDREDSPVADRAGAN